MVRMNPQTKIIVATAAALAAIDIAVRLLAPSPRTVVIRTGGGGEEIVARTIRLIDDSGRDRAVLKVDEQGEPGLLMFDRNGVERLQLDTFQNTPSLILMDRDERRRVYFGMDNDTGEGLYQTMNGAGSLMSRNAGVVLP